MHSSEKRKKGEVAGDVSTLMPVEPDINGKRLINV